MGLATRFALYRANLNRPSFWVLVVPLVLILLSRLFGAFLQTKTIEGWSFVICVFWSPLMVLHVFGAGKGWDDFKRKDYPKGLALLAMGLNLLAPFAVIYFILYV